MRLLSIPIAAALLCVGLANAQQGQDEAKAILEKALKAHGGEDVLRKFQAGTIKSKGRLEILNGLDVTQEMSFQLPDKFREEVSLEVNGMQLRVVTTFSAGKGAIEVNGKKLPADDKITEALKDGSQMLAAFRLFPLKDKAYELSVIGEEKVNGKPALGIRVSKKGQRDFTIFFDKATGLMAKAEQRTVDPMSGQEITQEKIVSEYKKFDGLPQPTKITVNRDGKKFLEAELTEYKQFEKLGDEMFTVP